MDHNHIQTWLESAAKKMLDKGYEIPRTKVTLYDSGTKEVGLSADIPVEARSSDDYTDSYIIESFYSSNLDELFERAHQWIKDLETPDTMAVRKFQRDLATIIDKANALGLDADLVNPLTQLSKKLSENAITKQ